MDQKEINNMISMEEFLNNLEGIVNKFCDYAQKTGKKIDDLETEMFHLSSKVDGIKDSVKKSQNDKKSEELDEIMKSIKEMSSNIEMLKMRLGPRRVNPVERRDPSEIKNVGNRRVNKPRKVEEKIENKE